MDNQKTVQELHFIHTLENASINYLHFDATPYFSSATNTSQMYSVMEPPTNNLYK